MSRYVIPLLAALGGAIFALGTGWLLGRDRPPPTPRGRRAGRGPSLVGAVLLSSFILLTGFQVAGELVGAGQRPLRDVRRGAGARDLLGGRRARTGRPRGGTRAAAGVHQGRARAWSSRNSRTGGRAPASWAALDQVRGGRTGRGRRAGGPGGGEGGGAVGAGDVYETRSDRAAEVKAGIPRVIWLAMVVAGAFLLSFPAVLGLTSSRRHLVAVCFAGAAVAFAIVLAAQLNDPFRQPFGVDRTAFTFAEARFTQMDAMRT